MAKSVKTAVKWPLSYQTVDLNSDTNLIKVVAMIAMLSDHTGKMFFHSNVMRIIGRMAFPLYAYCIAAGCVYTKDHLKYLSRIVLIGLISQPFYAVALDHTSRSMFSVSFQENPIRWIINFYVNSWGVPNVMLTLALGLLIIWAIREKQFVLAFALGLFVWKAQYAINYGWRGVLLVALFYLFCTKWWLSLPVMFTFMFWWGMDGSAYHLFGMSFGMQMFAVLALPLIYIHTHSNLKINKWVFYLFYPGHMIGMMLVQMAMKMS